MKLKHYLDRMEANANNLFDDAFCVLIEFSEPREKARNLQYLASIALNIIDSLREIENIDNGLDDDDDEQEEEVDEHE